MLETVKEVASELAKDSTTFADFYLDYVMSIQDEIIDASVNSLAKKVSTVDSITAVEGAITAIHDSLAEL